MASTLSVPEKCKFTDCNKSTHDVCEDCHGPFCSTHESPIDPDFCALCLPLTSVSVEEKPLTDDEGVTHKGRILIPTGNAFQTSAARIAEMSEAQLENHIEHLKTRVREAERSLDYHRISLDMAHMELGERGHIKRIQGLKKTSDGFTISAAEKSTRRKSDKEGSGNSVLAKLMKAGFTKEMAENMMAKVAVLKNLAASANPKVTQ